jgi:asparagine synthase (glutamine-hydrolysing)
MCGINGIISKKDNKKKFIKEMNDKIIHRGPNAEGIYTDEFVALGQRRLSIIDLDGGDQPIYNEDKSILIIYNGEVYNYQELKEELINHEFKTKTDTEVLIHAYEEWGYDFVKKLRGMFSLCIYDKNKEQLFIARDQFGIKPLYYYRSDDVFLFGSEIKSFLVHPDFKKELNKEMLGAYLTFSFTPGERTFFKDVYKLSAGHYMIINVNDMEYNITKYFDLSFSNTNLEFDKVVEEISETMKDSVKHHLISDVEVGSFLSSGVDSSYLVSLAKPDKTYTVGYTNKRYSEIDNARDLCDKLGINNTSSIITKEEYMEAITDVFYHMDEPTTDACSIAVYFLSKLASRDVKVVLSGEGADEFFGGYNSYDDHPYTKLPLWIRKMVAGICKVLPKNKYTRYLIRRGKSLEESYVSINRNYYDDELDSVLKYKDYLKNKDIVKDTYEEFKNENELNKKLAIDIKYWLTDNILNIVDKMTMAFSIESRVPFTDMEVFNVSRKLNKTYKVRNGMTKAALREAAKKDIPNDSYKKKKLGFPVPIRDWIREDDFYNEIKNTFNSDISLELFNNDYILNLLEEHKNGVRDNYRKIWAVYSFLKWYQVFFEDNNVRKRIKGSKLRLSE